MINSEDKKQSYNVIEHVSTMPPIAPHTVETVDYQKINDEIVKIWKIQFPDYYTDYISGQMLGKDNTKASITNILFILFNRLDECFTKSVEKNTTFDINSKKIINTLYINQKEALKRILSIYGNDKINVDIKNIIAFLSGYIISLLEIIKNNKNNNEN